MELNGMKYLGVQCGFLVAFLCSLVLVKTTKWHGKFSLDSMHGVQKFHEKPTPRIGGVAIFLGLASAWLLSDDVLSELFTPLLLAGLPAFCFGIAEDVTKRVSVRTRLFATMASGVMAWLLTGASITHIGVASFDSALAWLPASVLFTAFAVGGVANAVNIIDGFNGLASGTVAISLVALGLIAGGAGDMQLATLCFIVCAVTIGFFLVNFPFGKLFLGDGGAYLLGFVLAWLAVMLVFRNASVSPWAALLACAYPIFETVFTIMRRMWARTHPGQPDSHHLHSLIKLSISRRYFGAWRADLRNASVSPFSWLIAAVPAVLAVHFAGETGALLTGGAFSFLVYLAMYWYVASASRRGAQQFASDTDVDRAVTPIR